MATISYTNDYGDKIWEYFGIGNYGNGGGGGGGAVGVVGGSGTSSIGGAIGTGLAMLIELWKASKSTKSFYDWAKEAGYNEETAKKGEAIVNQEDDAVAGSPPGEDAEEEQKIKDALTGAGAIGVEIGKNTIVGDDGTVIFKGKNPALEKEKVEQPKTDAPEIVEPGIIDGGTNTDSGEDIGNYENSMLQYVEDMMAKQWEREDAIRKETQAREDTAWQRSIADMRAAGVNPNLVNAGPAASGGGVTNATGADYTPYTENLKAGLQLLMQELDQAFQGKEAEKDRVAKLVGSLINMFSSGTSVSTISKGK